MLMELYKLNKTREITLRSLNWLSKFINQTETEVILVEEKNMWIYGDTNLKYLIVKIVAMETVRADEIVPLSKKTFFEVLENKNSN